MSRIVKRPVGAALVVGGGIGGMQAALDLADAGFQVHLAERQSAVGGRMVQLDKTFPTNDCSMCTISPRLVHIGMHPNIVLHTSSTLERLEGEPGAFRATLRRRASFVDADRCKACGECLEVCPVELPFAFNGSRAKRKAIFKLYPQAVPGAYAIDRRGLPPCRAACPAHVNVQGYVALIRSGRTREAVALIRRDLPLPGVCGRICTHPCELACRRGELDQPVAIRALKRFAADCEREVGPVLPEARPRRDEDRVAVVGSGPAGLSAAYFLALDGCAVTLFEALDRPGGMLAVGVPAYRLPRDVLQAEIEAILSLGVELRTGVRVGRDLPLSELLDHHRAVFLAPGLHRGRSLGLEGETLEGVVQAVDLLRLAHPGMPVGQRAVVIGGGSVAMDAARTLVRLGAGQVTVVCLEQPHEMPAAAEEVEQAREEGVEIRCGWGPLSLRGGDGRVAGLDLRRCVGCLDASGAFAPRFDETEREGLAADQVVLAVGQAPDLTSGLPRTVGGRLQVDPVTLETEVPGLYAGGDAVSGPATVIEAVATGKRAAAAISRRLRGGRLPASWPDLSPEVELPRPEGPRAARQEPPVCEPARRLAPRGDTAAPDVEVVGGLSEEQARREAARCLDCGGCAECRQCETVCEAQAIQHGERERRIDLEVGSVILAPGFDPFDPGRRGELGHGRHKNVVSALELERLMSASGPSGGLLRRPSDDALPRRMAWIQCVGSRDERDRRLLCSAVCCMFATKQATLVREHHPDVETTIFLLDLRAHGKGFDAYAERARERGVRYVRALVSRVDEIAGSRDLELAFRDEQGRLCRELFGMVVLSAGLSPHASVGELARQCGVSLDRFGYASGDALSQGRTSRPGVYVAGAVQGPRDIPETVVGGSGAASLAAADMAAARGTRVKPRHFPPERDITGEELRIGVFVCRCGVNIARVVDVPAVTDYARTLPGVVHAEENLYSCSADTQRKMVRTIQEQRLNRVVVASCTPRTHEPLFRTMVRTAGLNRYLFEMANIRDQCSWVHADGEAATAKARDLVRMAVGRAATLEPLSQHRAKVWQSALVIGGGVAGLTAALGLCRQGFPVTVVEREREPGGNLGRLTRLAAGEDPRAFVERLVRRAREEPLLRLLTGSELARLEGHVGAFRATVRTPKEELELRHGAVIVAVGGQPAAPEGRYSHGADPRVMTQLDLERVLASGPAPRDVVMIQCVGSREGDEPVCSRVCCTQAVKNALRIKEADPDARVTVLYRDLRTYGARELLARDARRRGVRFVRFEPGRPPEVVQQGEDLAVRVLEPGLGRELLLPAEAVVLATGIRPARGADAVARTLKVPLGSDGFFQEAHMKLRPLDFAAEGVFLCGLAHGPKPVDEAITQARGAAARVATLLAHEELEVSGEVSVVDAERCIGCLTCVRACPYQVPAVGPDRVARIEPVSCQGCGICAAACPRQAIDVRHSTDDQVLAKITALFDEAVG